jgi:hypothetical protein
MWNLFEENRAMKVEGGERGGRGEKWYKQCVHI